MVVKDGLTKAADSNALMVFERKVAKEHMDLSMKEWGEWDITMK